MYESKDDMHERETWPDHREVTGEQDIHERDTEPEIRTGTVIAPFGLLPPPNSTPLPLVYHSVGAGGSGGRPKLVTAVRPTRWNQLRVWLSKVLLTLAWRVAP